MGTSKFRPPTPAQAEARRANGRKSNGPKTVAGKKISSLNGLKRKAPGSAPARQEASTRPLWQTMRELGEDAARYGSLLRDVTSSYPPRTPLHLLICEDVTRLILKLERVQRAQEARLVRAYQRLETASEKQMREMDRSASYDALQSEVLETGLRRAPDSPAKFSETIACLDRLRARVETLDFSDETELSALYGKNPTFRGAGIINAFRELASHPDDRELAHGLHLMILEETRDVAAENQLYYREHVEITRAMRMECLAPVDHEDLQLQRYEVALHRQLERKIKLLISMSGVSRRRAEDEDEEEPILVPEQEPLGWVESAPQPARGKEAAKAKKRKIDPAAEIRALALRHKLSTLRSSGPNAQQKYKEVVRQIHEIYGLTWHDEDEAAAPNARPEPVEAAPPPEGASPEQAGSEPENGGTEQQ